jgi:hypothetical protein
MQILVNILPLLKQQHVTANALYTYCSINTRLTAAMLLNLKMLLQKKILQQDEVRSPTKHWTPMEQFWLCCHISVVLLYDSWCNLEVWIPWQLLYQISLAPITHIPDSSQTLQLQCSAPQQQNYSASHPVSFTGEWHTSAELLHIQKVSPWD